MSAASRLAQRALLSGLFPGLEAALDLTKQSQLLVVTKEVATPAAARQLGEARLYRWLKARGVRKADDLARRIIMAAKDQSGTSCPPRERRLLYSGRDRLRGMLRTKQRIAALLEGRLE